MWVINMGIGLLRDWNVPNTHRKIPDVYNTYRVEAVTYAEATRFIEGIFKFYVEWQAQFPDLPYPVFTDIPDNPANPLTSTTRYDMAETIVEVISIDHSSKEDVTVAGTQ